MGGETQVSDGLNSSYGIFSTSFLSGSRCDLHPKWDLKGNKYLDFTMVGVGSCVLGYSDKDIDRVAKTVISQGPLTTLNPPEEILLAEKLTEIHPWAEQVKFARTGGEMVAVAIRLARSYTGRDKILICGYHGWHDWYLATNLGNTSRLNNHLLSGLEPKGVPQGLSNSVIPFNFNSCKDVKEIIEIVGKKNIPLSVNRSRLRRVIREGFRTMLPPTLGIDLVVLVKPAANQSKNVWPSLKYLFLSVNPKEQGNEL